MENLPLLLGIFAVIIIALIFLAGYLFATFGFKIIIGILIVLGIWSLLKRK